MSERSLHACMHICMHACLYVNTCILSTFLHHFETLVQGKHDVGTLFTGSWSEANSYSNLEVRHHFRFLPFGPGDTRFGNYFFCLELCLIKSICASPDDLLVSMRVIYHVSMHARSHQAQLRMHMIMEHVCVRKVGLAWLGRDDRKRPSSNILPFRRSLKVGKAQSRLRLRRIVCARRFLLSP